MTVVTLPPIWPFLPFPFSPTQAPWQLSIPLPHELFSTSRIPQRPWFTLSHTELELQGRAKTLFQNNILNVLTDRSSQTVCGPRLQELRGSGFSGVGLSGTH